VSYLQLRAARHCVFCVPERESQLEHRDEFELPLVPVVVAGAAVGILIVLKETDGGSTNIEASVTQALHL